MILIGLASVGFLVYGIYLICYEEQEENNETPQNSLEIEPIIPQPQPEPQEGNKEIPTDESVEEDHDPALDDLWSSYHLEAKYDEMKGKKGLREYLNVGEWKKKIRRRFKNILHSKEYKQSPMKYIYSSRSKRAKNEYAVVEDTVLNLLEHYEILNSQEEMQEMKEITCDSQGNPVYQE